eukprot:3184218-Amphidinium_carterae.1
MTGLTSEGGGAKLMCSWAAVGAIKQALRAWTSSRTCHRLRQSLMRAYPHGCDCWSSEPTKISSLLCA